MRQEYDFSNAKKNLCFVSCLAFTLLLGSACTTEAWYEGVKRSAEDNCRKQSGNAVDECLSRVNRQTYQEYEKSRSGNK
ncbi:MAG: hypothetical protein RIR18_60 [Pseudomonadota bacterium]|jgi:hypothetical protein